MDERLKVAIDELRKLAKGDDLRDIGNLAKRFDDAIAAVAAAGDKETKSAARAEARGTSKDAFALEKRYVPWIPGNKSISQKLNCENMIMTVGFQKEPIILSILCMEPKKVILLHTDGSRQTARDVEDDPDIKNMGIEIIPLLITEYDASENYRVIKEQALARVSDDEVTVIDPTAGRKVMIASLALVAFYMRLKMVYVHGVEQDGVIFPFTERLQFIENPFDFFGDTELGLVEEQFNCHLYEAAYSMCQQLQKKVLDLATRSKVAMIQELIQVYLDWDAFLHSSMPKNKRLDPLLSQRLENIMDDFRKMGLGKCLPDNVDANLEFLRILDKTWRNKKNIVDEFRLVDIFASALRRAKQKKYDDAVGRLYRCLEMCSTIKLMGLGLKDTAKPDYSMFSSRLKKTPKWLEDEYEKRKHRQLPLERLALDNQMTLLDIAGENIANIYESMKKQERGFESLMEIRNRSILAHGTNPVPEERWPDFKRKAEVIIEKTIGKERFQELLAMAMHNELHIH